MKPHTPTPQKTLILPVLAAGCFALMGNYTAMAAINVDWDGGAGTAFWDDNNNWSPDANVDGPSDSSGYAAFISNADTVIRDSRTIYRTNTNSTAGNTASTTIGSGGFLTMGNGQRLNWVGGASVGDATLTIENGGTLSADFFDTNQGAGSTATFEVLSGGTATFGSSFSMNDSVGTGNVVVDGAGSTMTVSGATNITGSATNTLTISNGGTFAAGGNFTYDPTNLDIGGGGSRFELGTGSTGGAMTNLNTITIASGGTFAVNQSDAVTQGTEFGNSISGAGSIEQAGTGTTTLNVANSHTGGTTLNSGTLVLGDAAAAGTGTITLSGGTLQGGNLTYTNDISVTAGTSTAVIAVGGNSQFSGAITGTGTLNFGGDTAGQTDHRMRLDGDLTGFSGTITHNNDGLQNYLDLFGVGTSASNVKVFTSGDTGTADTFASDGIRIVGDTTIAELSGTGGRFAGWNGTLTIDQNTDTTYSGRLDNMRSDRLLSIVKDGTGTLTLDFDNSYRGTSTVSGGSLIINGDQTVATGAVNVSGGTLGGTGTVGGDTTVSGSGKLSAGVDGIGTLSFNQIVDVSSAGANSMLFDLQAGVAGIGTGDLVSMTSSELTIGSGTMGFEEFSFTDLGISSSARGEYVYTLFDAGTGSVNGTLDSLDSFTTGLFAGTEWAALSIDGDNLLLTVFVPEPSSTALLGLGGLALMLRRKRS